MLKSWCACLQAAITCEHGRCSFWNFPQSHHLSSNLTTNFPTGTEHCSYLSTSFGKVCVAPGVRGQYYGWNWQISCLLQDSIYCFSQICCYVTPPSSLIICKTPLCDTLLGLTPVKGESIVGSMIKLKCLRDNLLPIDENSSIEVIHSPCNLDKTCQCFDMEHFGINTQDNYSNSYPVHHFTHVQNVYHRLALM